jgi:hypothetical protein
MAYLPALIIGVLALAVLVAQFHYLLRLRERGHDTTMIVLLASFFGLLMCEEYLGQGGDGLRALTTAFILSISAVAVWRDARRRARDARIALLTEAPQPRCS